MADTLAVTRYQRSVQPDSTTISATIGGFEVWFRGSQLAKAPERGDPFLAVALLPAMYAGADLDLRDLPPVSTRLLTAMDHVQEIWTTWNPELKRITIRARPAAGGAPDLDRTATCFSGGVDAVHSVVAGGAPGEELVFINGFDFSMSPAEFATAVARLERLAGKLDCPLGTITTNWIDYTRQGRIARSTSHGGCLHAVTHLVAPSRMTIAASYAWDHLHPWGSHPLLDEHWSSDLTETRHFGSDAWRTDKVAVIAQRPELLEDLWVCHKLPDRNCGRCSKCLRTMAVLQLLGAPLTGFATPAADPITGFLNTVPSTAEDKFVAEFARLAVEVGAPQRVHQQIAATERALARRTALRVWRKVLRPGPKPVSGSPDLWPWGFGRPLKY